MKNLIFVFFLKNLIFVFFVENPDFPSFPALITTGGRPAGGPPRAVRSPRGGTRSGATGIRGAGSNCPHARTKIASEIFQDVAKQGEIIVERWSQHGSTSIFPLLAIALWGAKATHVATN